MRSRIWKVVWLFAGIVFTLSLALMTGVLALPPSSGKASMDVANVETLAAEPTDPPAASAEIIPTYPDLPAATVDQVTHDWLVYTDEVYGFRIRYPAHFDTVSWPVTGVREMYVSFIDRKWKGHYEVPDIGIVVYRNPENLPLQAWLQSKVDGSELLAVGEDPLFYAPTDIQNINVAGTPALKFVDGGLGPAPSVLVVRGEYILELYYAPVGPDNLEPIYELMLATLELKDL